MGAPVSGYTQNRAASYSKKYDNPSSVDLTEAISVAKHAASSLLCIATGADAALTYEDCLGTSVAITDVPDGAIFQIPCAVKTLVSSTTMDVVAFWHV
jgi:hypothetical protein